MSNEVIVAIKPFIAVVAVAIVFVIIMRKEYRTAVKSILGAVLVWLGLRE